MFKNRSFNVKMVKDQTPTQDVTVGNSIDAVNHMIAETAKPMALAIAYVIGAKTLSEVVLHIAKTKIK